jgi:sec-independent protein translocase protein TatC
MARPVAPDVPMSLGDHLHELRNRLVLPAACFALVFCVAFAYQNQLTELFIQPLLWAIAIAGPEVSAKAGLVVPPGGDATRLLKIFDLSESVWISVSLSIWAAAFFTIPIFVQQLWAFVTTGLTAKERRLGFLLVPVGIICFYLGAVIGYYWGMPLFFAWFIQFTAHDPIGAYDLRMENYRDTFFFYTLSFGLVMDIPWLVVVLCRVGLTTAAKLGQWRKAVFMICTVIAGIITPPDPMSMIAMLVPMYLLFELGLIIARLVAPKQPAEPSHV